MTSSRPVSTSWPAYDVLATSDATALAATQAYIDLQRYRDMELLARQNYSLHEETLKQIGQRAESGVGRRVDLEQAGAAGPGADQPHDGNRQPAGRAAALPARDRRPAPETLQPVPDVDAKLPAKPGDFNDSLRRNPSFLSKQAGLQAAEAGIASAKGAFSPKFEFVASTGRNQNDPTPENRRINSTSVQLMMSYNLYRGGADSARVRQTSAQSYAARDIRDYTCRNVQQDLAVAWNNITSLNQRMPFLRDHEVATAKVRDAYRQQFQIGQRTLLDLLNTENELFDRAAH